MTLSLLDRLALGAAATLGMAALLVVMARGRRAPRRWQHAAAVLALATTLAHLLWGASTPAGGAAGWSLANWAVALALVSASVALVAVTQRDRRGDTSRSTPASPVEVPSASAAAPSVREGARPSLPSNEHRLAALLFDGSGELPATLTADASPEFDVRLMHANRMQSIGRLAGGIAHDFNNLLTSILTSAELAREALPAEHGVAPDLEEIRRAGTRASELTRQLLAFARRDVARPRVIDANSLVANLATMLRRVLGEPITLRMSLGSDVPLLLADSAQLEQVIVNLAVNARDAMPSGGVLQLRTSRGLPRDSGPDGASGSGLVLEVEDTGVGMSEEVRDRLFEPFFTTKTAGRGTGLGLATCHAIVSAHGGEITVQSRAEEGTTFRIWLPASEDVDVVAPTEPAHLASAERSSGVRTILLVEDDADVRTSTARALRRTGYEVLEAADGEEALALASTRSAPVDLIVTDVVMPRVGGVELVRRLERQWPGVRTLFMSGYPGDSAEVREVQASGAPLLEKPYTPSILLFEVRLRLDPARSA